jgi:TM2 domain-containing membrane protein YozV
LIQIDTTCLILVQFLNSDHAIHMRHIILIGLIGIISVGFSQYSSAQDIYDKTNSKKYADYLFKSKDFTRAAIEYERVCFLDSLNWDAHFLLIQSYRKSENAPKGIDYYKKLRFKLPEFYQLKFEHENNICVFNTNPNLFLSINEGDSIANLVYFKAPALLLSHNWKKSISYLELNAYKSDKTLTHYYNFSQEGLRINYKKPLLAATLSTLVPGLGKVYTGYYKDGIIAFVMTGLSAYQAYRGYNARGVKSGLFIIYAGMTTGFYIGNIYGAVKSAKLKNRRLNETIDSKTKQVFYDWAE